jgi:hypothetical protein
MEMGLCLENYSSLPQYCYYDDYNIVIMILIHSKMTCQVAVGIAVIFESSRFLATQNGGTTTVISYKIGIVGGRMVHFVFHTTPHPRCGPI